VDDMSNTASFCTRSAPAARLRPGAESSIPGAAASLH